MNIYLRDIFSLINPLYKKYSVGFVGENSFTFYTYYELEKLRCCVVKCISAHNLPDGAPILSFVLEKV